jgi:ABC-2 type transport system permease protein
MSKAWRIARAEWALLARSRVALIGMIALVLLSVIAAVTSAAQAQAELTQRQTLQIETDALFEAQPARHPHRMVHYGIRSWL